MKKTQFIGAASSISVIAGLTAILLLGGIGFSIAGLMDPVFYVELLNNHLIDTLVGFVLLGVSLGALFSATRFLDKFQATGLAALTSLIVVLIGSTFFWNQISTYTILGLGYSLGATLIAFFTSNARGTKFSIGYENAKKVIAVMSVIALFGTILLVSGDRETYQDQFKSGITGLGVISAEQMTDSMIEEIIKDETPKMTFEEFTVDISSNYESLTPEQTTQLQDLYQEYSTEYDTKLAQAVQNTREQLNKSSNAAETLVSSMSFMELVLNHIELFYAFSLFFILLMAQAILIGPFAGATSWVFHYPLPPAAQPKPEEQDFESIWEEETIEIIKK